MPTTKNLQSGLHFVKSLGCLLEEVEDQRCAEVALLLALVHLEDLREDRIVDVVSKVQHVLDVLVVLRAHEAGQQPVPCSTSSHPEATTTTATNPIIDSQHGCEAAHDVATLGR